MGRWQFIRKHSTLIIFSLSLGISSSFVACGSSDSGRSGGNDFDAGDADVTGGSGGVSGGGSGGVTGGTGGGGAGGVTGGTGGGGAGGGGAGGGGAGGMPDAMDDVATNGDAMMDVMVDGM